MIDRLPVKTCQTFYCFMVDFTLMQVLISRITTNIFLSNNILVAVTC